MSMNKNNILIAIICVCIIKLLQSISLKSDLANLVKDFSLKQNWKHLNILQNDFDDLLLPKSDVRNLFYLFSNLLIGNKLQFNTYIRFIEANKIIEEDPIFGQQFFCIWNEKLIQIFDKAGKMNFFVENQEWFIVLGGNITMEKFEDLIDDIPSFIESDVRVIKFSFQERKWKIYEIWRIGPKWRKFERNEIGDWTRESGLDIKEKEQKYERRKDMKGYNIRLVTLNISSPYASIFPNNTEGSRSPGICDEIFYALKDHLNFTFVFFLRRPELESSWDLYLLPFDFSLWSFIPVYIFATAIAFWGFGKIPNFFRISGDNFNVSNSLWTIISFLVQRGVNFEPRQLSTRIIFIFTCFSLLVLFTSYSAFIVSILTTLKPKLPFRTFEDLRKLSGWKIATNSRTSMIYLLKDAPEGSAERHAFDHKLIKNITIHDMEETLKKTLEGNFAYLTLKDYTEYYLYENFPYNESSKIINTGVPFLKPQISFAVQKRSPFLKIWNIYLIKMKSSGIFHKLYKTYFKEFSREPDKSHASIGFKEVLSLFIFLALGIFVSLICLAAERKYQRLMEY